MTIKVDLLPTERKKFGFDPVIAFLVIIIAIFVVGFYVYGTQLDRKIEAKNGEIAQVEQKIAQLKNQLPIIEELKKENAQLQQQIDTVKSLRYDPIRYSNLLDEISLLIPKNVWLQSISIDPATNLVSMSGTAMQMPGVRPLESIAGFMKSLQKSRFYRDATLANTSRGTVKTAEEEIVTYGFQIESHYDPRAAEEGGGGQSSTERVTSQISQGGGNL